MIYRSVVLAMVLAVSSIVLFTNMNEESYSWLPYWSKNARNTLNWNQELRFTKDGTFQISVFEDLHYGEGENPLVSIFCGSDD